MAKPQPTAGLLITYDYLWASEDAQGYSDGDKYRPCAVVVALQPRDGQPLRAMVCGITHSKPRWGQDGVAIPLDVKKQLGLDDQPSWVIVDEANIVDWDDAGIVQAHGKWSPGTLPRLLMEQIRDRATAHSKSGKFESIKRQPRTASGEEA